MSDDIPTQEPLKRQYRRRSGADIPEHMAVVDPSLGNLSREEIGHGVDRERVRVPMHGGDLKLSVARKYVSNPDYYYHWFYDGDGDRIRRAQDAAYDFVTDENGQNITKNNGGKKLYLMALHKKFREEDDMLKKKRLDATMGREMNKDLGVAGLETFTESKFSESTERF